ncbi:hypothetical protein [Actinoplanes sp. OR16]|uniref:hypothetical protein n=1 Tax=Actinoplanes sp. OR16 TaxID=946334 RepID=UPI000FD9C41A|nr:hypothetical protein [Actinoplanes sp. OR16]
MSDERRLRDGLEAIAVPASGVRVEALLPAARKQKFRRNAARATAGAAVAVGVLVAVPVVLLRPTAATPAPVLPAQRPSSSPSPSVTACRMVKLPLPEGLGDAGPEAVDPTGTYIVGNGTEGQDFRPVLWTRGKASALPVNADSVQATAVNSSGVVVGLATRNNRDTVFRFAGGAYTELKLPAGEWHPYPEPAINAAGDVVINAEPQGNSGGEGVIALLWPAGSTDAVRLPLPEGAHVVDILDDGRMAGGIYKDGTAREPWVWDRQGKGQKLTVPAGRNATAYSISGDWVTGGVWEPGNAALWNLRTGKLTQTTGDQNPGQAVNASGWVIDGNGRLIRDGKASRLPAGGGRKVAYVSDVSDTGLVVGHVTEEQTEAEEQDILDGGGQLERQPQFPATWQC